MEMQAAQAQPHARQQVTLLRPAMWQGGSHPTYSVSVQPGVVAGRQRVATASSGQAAANAAAHALSSHRCQSASLTELRLVLHCEPLCADKAHGVCIWDLEELSTPPSESEISVKLEGGGAFAPSRAPRGLLAVLPHHLSAVNVVRWEPGIGARLASGSDLPTQSIIVWRREEAGEGSGDSSTPFGINSSDRSASKPSSSSAGDNPAPAFPNVETWVAQLSLHGQIDITDLAWAPVGLHFREVDDPFGLGAASAVGCVMDAPSAVAARLAKGLGSQVLASCSLDRSVIVWNVDTGDRHSLKGHSGWVLGVAFDPRGQLLATQSIDGFVWVWNLSSMQLVRKIRDVGLEVPGAMASAPKIDVGRTVSMARISWTPDGAALVACRGELRRGRKHSSSSTSLAARAALPSRVSHVSVALNRKRNFETQAVFGGHSGRTTVSAFNPVLFCTDTAPADNGKPATPNFFSVLAVGSHDCVLSLWSTRRSTPLLLVTELWTDSILDLSWSADGRTLLVASHDGSIVVLQFDIAVFDGRPATQQEQDERMRSLYGDAQANASEQAEAMSAIGASSGLLASAQGLYDSPAALEAQAQQKAAQLRLQQVAAAEQKKAHALERSASDARRQAGVARQNSNGAAAPAAANSQSAVPGPSTLSQQTEVRRADGKRRIVPVSVPAPTAESSAGLFIAGAPVRSTSTSATQGASTASHLAQATPAMLLELTGGDATAASASSDAADLFSGAAAQQPRKRKHAGEGDEQDAAIRRKSSPPVADAGAAASAVAASSPLTVAAASTSATASSRPVSAASDDLVLRPPPRQVRWLLPMAMPASPASPFATKPSVAQWELQVTDHTGRALSAAGAAASSSAAASAAASEATLVTAHSALAAVATGMTPVRSIVWQSFVQHRVLLSVGNSHMLALACADTVAGRFYLHVLSSASGRQLHPPLLLTAPPFALSLRSFGARLGMLLLVTCDGLVRVYDQSSNVSGKRLRVQASVRTMLRAPPTAAGTQPSGNKATAAAASAVPSAKKKSQQKEPGLSIIAARLNAYDAPVLVLSNHASFVYDSSFESWTLLSSSSAASAPFPGSEVRSELSVFQRTAEQQTQREEEEGSVSTLPPRTRTAAQAPASLSLLASMDARTRVLHTLAHLESDVSLSLQRADASAYRSALTSYVAKLVSFYPAMPSALLKLREVCAELSGPGSGSGAAAAAMHSHAAPASSATDLSLPPRWQPFILGLSKRALLTSLMPLLHTNPHLGDFTRQLTQAEER